MFGDGFGDIEESGEVDGDIFDARGRLEVGGEHEAHELDVARGDVAAELFAQGGIAQ